MEKLSYKTFIWPQNPHTYREEYIREPAPCRKIFLQEVPGQGRDRFLCRDG